MSGFEFEPAGTRDLVEDQVAQGLEGGKDDDRIIGLLQQLVDQQTEDEATDARQQTTLTGTDAAGGGQ